MAAKRAQLSLTAIVYALGYSNCSSASGWAFICAMIDREADCRMRVRVSSAVSLATSTSRMRDSAVEADSNCLLRLLIVMARRF